MKYVPHVATIVALLLLTVAPAQAQSAYRGYQPGDTGSLRGVVSLFEPDGDSAYWDDKFADFTGSISDFEDLDLSLDYRFPLDYGSALLFSMGWYKGQSTQAYREWTDASGRDISHLTTLWTFELSGAWIYEFGGRRHHFTPYAGVGAGYLWWDLEEAGDFIDFNDADLPIVRARYIANSGTYEYFFLAGVDLRISPNMSLVVQGRWREADDELGGDFAGFGTLDLSGIQYGVGLAVHF